MLIMVESHESLYRVGSPDVISKYKGFVSFFKPKLAEWIIIFSLYFTSRHFTCSNRWPTLQRDNGKKQSSSRMAY